MKIALRTSGGRGEYELAGRQGDVRNSDLFDLPMVFEITPDVQIEGKARTRWVQGKPRIRLDQGGIHAYRLLAAVLLLPKPKRELNRTPAGDSIQKERDCYAVGSIKVDVGRVFPHMVVLRPTDLLLTNRAGTEERLVFAKRMGEILTVWNSCENVDGELCNLIRRHQEIVSSGVENAGELERVATSMQRHFETDSDVLPVLKRALGFEQESDQDPVDDSESRRIDVVFAEEDEVSPEEARRRNVRRWRKIAVRGRKAQVFRRRVRDAYDHRCLFSGYRLPRLSVTGSSGVKGHPLSLS